MLNALDLIDHISGSPEVTQARLNVASREARNLVKYRWKHIVAVAKAQFGHCAGDLGVAIDCIDPMVPISSALVRLSRCGVPLPIGSGNRCAKESKDTLHSLCPDLGHPDLIC